MGLLCSLQTPLRPLDAAAPTALPATLLCSRNITFCHVAACRANMLCCSGVWC